MLWWIQLPIAVAAAAPAPPPGVQPSRTSTVAAAPPLSAEDAELARYLDLLEDYELLQQLPMTELLDVLEEDPS